MVRLRLTSHNVSILCQINDFDGRRLSFFPVRGTLSLLTLSLLTLSLLALLLLALLLGLVCTGCRRLQQTAELRLFDRFMAGLESFVWFTTGRIGLVGDIPVSQQLGWR